MLSTCGWDWNRRLFLWQSPLTGSTLLMGETQQQWYFHIGNGTADNLQPATSHSGTLVKFTQWNGEGHSYNSQAKLMVLFVCAKSLLAQNKSACSQQQLDMVTLMSRFANNALFGCEVRVRAWIREQRSKEDRRHCQAFVGNPGHLLLFVHNCRVDS